MSATPPTATGRYGVLMNADNDGTVTTHLIAPFSKEDRAVKAAERLNDYAALAKLTLTTQVLPLEGAFQPGQTATFLDAIFPGAAERIQTGKATAADEVKAAKAAEKAAAEEAAKAAIPAEAVDAAKAVAADALIELLGEAEAKADADNQAKQDSMEAEALAEAGFPKMAARKGKATAPETVIEGVAADKPKPKRNAKPKAA